jgi:hypothetical protein
MGRPGKFEGCNDQDLGEELHAITMDSGQDDELGEVDGFGWYGLIIDLDYNGKVAHYIVHEDNAGFFDYTVYDTETEAREAWAVLEADYDAFNEEDADIEAED